MVKIMFVCHGNICRSPMAEFIMKDMVKRIGLEDNFFIASCATSREELGHGVYPPARDELKKHGIDCFGKRSVQLTAADYNKYDMLICMDSYNVRNALKILGDDPDKKVKKLMDFTDRPGDVDDPWYNDRFDIAYRDIYDGCKALLDHITA